MRGQISRRKGTSKRREEVVAQEAAVLVHGFGSLHALAMEKAWSVHERQWVMEAAR